MATVAPATAGRATRNGSASERLSAATLAAVSWAVCRLPEAPLRGLAEIVGLGWYLVSGTKRSHARRNLRRVATALTAQGKASPRVAAAARSRLALERLVLVAFRHLGRYYFEVARVPAFSRERVTPRIEDRSGGVFRSLVAEGRGMGHGPGTGVILVGLHLGALEFPSFLLREAGIQVTAPMEVIDNAPMQAYFMRTRSHDGLRLIPQENSVPELEAALGRGYAAGLVSDRVVRGRGGGTTLFGYPLRLPNGSGLLSLETGTPVYTAAVWRLGGGRYAGTMYRVEVPTDGERTDRLQRFLDALAKAFESLIAEAPEQWWTAFFPLWPDLERGDRRRRRGAR